MSFARQSHALILFVLSAVVFSANLTAQDKPRNRMQSSTFGEAYRNTYGRLPAKATLGDRMMADYFHVETRKVSERSLSSLASKSPPSLEDWDRHKEEYRRQLFEMLSLEPIPLRTDLHSTVTGRLDHTDFTVEKLHFQSRPGLYVTANVYVPKGAKKPMPAILYVCGHGQVKIDGISFGNKVTYQHHGAWFAKNGYVCIILDSVQLGEIEGIHHGTHNKGMWWWNSQGYTSAGAEAWNCIRALDYLESRIDVDAQRIGVTGRSGGGAYSWWIAALDERIQVACPVAGITDLQNHVDDGCVEGHCDCMFMVNTYGWDYAQVAALVAPRPLLICNTDKDTIFPLDGVVRLHSKVRRVYDLYEAHDKLGLLITEGPHKDTQELQLPVMRWFNKWLKKEDVPVANYAEKLFDPQELRVFQQLPKDEITSRCFDGFTSLATDSNSFDPVRAAELLRTKTFGAWPREDEIGDAAAFKLREISQSVAQGVRLQVYEFESQPGIRLRLYVMQPVNMEVDSLNLEIVDQSKWKEKLEVSRVGFAAALKEELEFANFDANQKIDPSTEASFSQWMSAIRQRKATDAFFGPRGIGLTALGEDEKYRTQVRRRFMLLGATLASSQVWDVRRAALALRSLPDVGSLPHHYHASSEMTEIGTFAALFESKLGSLSLERPPRSDKEAPDFLNWARFTTPKQLLDMVKTRTIIKIN